MEDFPVSAVNAPSVHYVDIYDQGIKINDHPVPVVDGVWSFPHTYSDGRHALTATAANAASAEYVFDVLDEVHEDFRALYRWVSVGREETVVDELKHFSLRNTVGIDGFGVNPHVPPYGGLWRSGLQGGEVKFNTGWKRVVMRFILSGSNPANQTNSGKVTFYDQARRELETRQTKALRHGQEETLEYMAPEGSFIGYAIFGCGGSDKNSVTVNDIIMSR